MDLFDNKIDAPINLISQDGIVGYYGALQSPKDADDYFVKLMDKIKWKNDEVIIYGKKIVTKRKVAWYGDQPFEFTYSNTTKRALPWIKELLALKALVEERSNETFNSCLLNLYHNGQEGMSWHCDEERDLKRNGAIGSLSFGAERKFSLKHKKSKETISLILQHGSLLVMKGTTQTNWLHSLPPTTKIAEPRINLTFRTIVS